MNIEKKGEGKVRVIILMLVMMMMGCNSGGVKGEGTGGGDGRGGSLSEVMLEVGRSAENAFYAFLELMSDVLGFSVNTTTKKEDVGNHFKSLGVKLGKASEELEEVAKKSETGGDKNDSSKNLIKEIVDSARGVLGTLKGYLESLGTVGDSKPVGEAGSDATGASANEGELSKALKALKGIVEIAKGAGVAEPIAGIMSLNGTGIDNKEGVRILATDNKASAVTDAGKAALIVSSVSGEEILASIVKSEEGDSALGGTAPDDKTTAV
ncbi:variable large family protein, partial [Borrelia duttonii]